MEPLTKGLSRTSSGRRPGHRALRQGHVKGTGAKLGQTRPEVGPSMGRPLDPPAFSPTPVRGLWGGRVFLLGQIQAWGHSCDLGRARRARSPPALSFEGDRPAPWGRPSRLGRAPRSFKK